jgi:hypothetical protein
MDTSLLVDPFICDEHLGCFYFLVLVNRAVINIRVSQVLVVHTCNPNYSGGRDWENQCLKPAQANSL